MFGSCVNNSIFNTYPFSPLCSLSGYSFTLYAPPKLKSSLPSRFLFPNTFWAVKEVFSENIRFKYKRFEIYKSTLNKCFSEIVNKPVEITIYIEKLLINNPEEI